MKTVKPTNDALDDAAEALRRGELVVMPTETVYGLAADAMNPDAVRRIFAAKGRPSDNPLIVHLASLDDLDLVAADIPNEARKLADRFWPGPLTMVLKKQPHVPYVTTGGLETVAVRVPAHPVARELIRRAGTPIAAPSANPFMGLSPTRVEHLDRNLIAQVSLVIEGGASFVGLESTVVDLTQDTPRLLRPGGISRADLQAALGKPLASPPSGARLSPGMYARHYAPKTPVRLVAGLDDEAVGLTLDSPANPNQIKMPEDARAYMATLYDALHRLDALAAGEIQVQAPPDTPAWEAVRDRLKKAATEANP